MWRDMDLMSAKSPTNAPAKRKLKPRQSLHHDRIDVLLVKTWLREDPVVIRLFGVLSKWIDVRTALETGIIFWLIKNAGRRVVIDYLDAISSRSRCDFFSRYLNLRRQNFAVDLNAWILRDDRQQPGSWFCYWYHERPSSESERFSEMLEVFF